MAGGDPEVLLAHRRRQTLTVEHLNVAPASRRLRQEDPHDHAALGRRRRYRPPAPARRATPLNGTFRRRATDRRVPRTRRSSSSGRSSAGRCSRRCGSSFTDASGFGDPSVRRARRTTCGSSPTPTSCSRSATRRSTRCCSPRSRSSWPWCSPWRSTTRRCRSAGFFRSTLFLPFIVSLAVAAFAWSYLLDPQIGLLNYWLQVVGIRLGNVLQDPTLAMPTVVLVAVWKNFGFYMVIFLAGLQEIPTQPLRGGAAGRRERPASGSRTSRFPMLSNTHGVRRHRRAHRRTAGVRPDLRADRRRPVPRTETIVMQIYQSGFKDLDLGFASRPGVRAAHRDPAAQPRAVPVLRQARRGHRIMTALPRPRDRGPRSDRGPATPSMRWLGLRRRARRDPRGAAPRARHRVHGVQTGERGQRLPADAVPAHLDARQLPGDLHASCRSGGSS